MATPAHHAPTGDSTFADLVAIHNDWAHEGCDTSRCPGDTRARSAGQVSEVLHAIGEYLADNAARSPDEESALRWVRGVLASRPEETTAAEKTKVS